MINGSNYTYLIGIDTGTKTGFAAWCKPEKRFLEISTMMIHKAMDKVLEYHRLYTINLFVRFEDARLRTWFNNKSVESLQGAGSIKRDCAIWDDFLKDYGINYASVAPRNSITKLAPDKFTLITGWVAKTNDHGRDAAMLVFGF